MNRFKISMFLLPLLIGPLLIEGLKVPCSSSTFRCANGDCINRFIYNNGIEDCIDGSDELEFSTCAMKCDGDKCVDREKICDDIKDCQDNSDESNCPDYWVHRNCTSEEFKCQNGRCIFTSKKCNNNDHSRPDQIICHDFEFICGDGHCINRKKRCDGEIDCDDGDDEENCDNCSAERGGFQCKDHKNCLAAELVCDGTSHCEDYSDEDFGDDKFCSISCRTKKCSHDCYKSPTGPKCSCRKGYSLDGETKCKDNDECSTNKILCDHFCNNTEGSYECMCADGYTLQGDGATCLDASKSATILFAGQTFVRQFSTNDPNTVKVIVDFSEYIFSVTYDPIDGDVYFSTRTSISKKRGDEIIPIFMEKGFQQIETIVMDYIGRNLYIVDQKLGQILVCNVNNKYCTPIVKGLESGRALALDLKNRYMFYTDKNQHLKRADLDGRNTRLLIDLKEEMFQNSIALDEAVNKIYWIDAKNDVIGQSDYEGKHKKTYKLRNNGRIHPFSMVIWQDKVYWGDWQADVLVSHSKRNGSVKYDHEYHHDDIFTLAIYPDDIYPGPSISLQHCSHITLLSKTKSVTCKCAVGFQLKSDKKTCENNGDDVKIIYEFNHKVYDFRDNVFTFKTNENPHLTGHVQNVYSPEAKIQSISYNPRENSFLFLYNSRDLYKISPEKKQNPILLHKFRSVKVIAYDWLRNNIYWISISSQVGVIKRKGGKTVSRYLPLDHDTYTSIAVDPIDGHIFLSTLSNIKRCNLNGFNCTEIITTMVLHPTSLLVDQFSANRRLFWIDSIKIKSCELDGNNRMTHENFIKPSNLAVDDNYLYWTNTEDPKIFYKKKTESKDVEPSSKDILHAGEHSYHINLVSLSLGSYNKIQDPCQHSKCSDFCFSAENKETCDCHQDSHLESDGVSCKKSCKESQFECNDKQCISSLRKCDGYDDCADGSDEFECPCTEEQFTCDDGQCVHLNEVCNSMYDCNDKSDERNCTECKENQFLCDFNKCISLTSHCDGQVDCADKTDEKHCSCKSNYKKCDDGKCIPTDQWCDGVADCDDRSDENCNRIDTSRRRLSKFMCPNSPVNLVDKCEMGCICTQQCEMKDKNYECSCVEGYTLSNDKRTCSNGIDGGYYEVYGNKIFNPKLSKYVEEFSHNITGLIYFLNSNETKPEIFIIDTRGNIINNKEKYEINLPILKDASNFSIARGSIDKLYFLKDYQTEESRSSCIHMCNLMSLDCSILYCTENKIKSLVVDSDHLKMYFFEYLIKTTILYQATLDGQHLTVVDADLQCDSLAVDPRKGSRGTLYWTNRHLRIIKSADLSSFRQRIITTELVDSPVGLSLMNNDLIFYNKDKGEIVTCVTSAETFHEASHSNCKSIVNPTVSFVVGQTLSSINNTDPCLNNDCSHNCVPVMNNYKCLCKIGYARKNSNDCVHMDLCPDECEEICSHKSFGEECKMCDPTKPCLPKISKQLLVDISAKEDSSARNITIIVFVFVGLIVLLTIISYRKRWLCFNSNPRYKSSNTIFRFREDQHGLLKNEELVTNKFEDHTLFVDDSPNMKPSNLHSSIDSGLCSNIDVDSSPPNKDSAPIQSNDVQLLNYTPYQP